MYGNEEIKLRILNTEIKKMVLKITQQNLILQHSERLYSKTYSKMTQSEPVDSIDFRTLRKI